MSRRLMLRKASGGILPSGYRRVNCITIPEGGSINTGLLPTVTSEIEIVARINSDFSVNRAIWYSRGSGTVMFQYVNAYASDTGYAYQYGRPYIQRIGTKDNLKHTFYSKGRQFVVDNISQGMLPYAPRVNEMSDRPILLAARQNQAGTAYEQCSNLTVWSYQHNSDTQRSQTLVPCQRLSDSAFGMYDIEADAFIGNSGTGVITEGVE